MLETVPATQSFLSFIQSSLQAPNSFKQLWDEIEIFPKPSRLPSESSLAFCRRKDYFFRIQNLNFLLFCAAANENFAEPQKYMQEHDTFSELLSFYLAREEDE